MLKRIKYLRWCKMIQLTKSEKQKSMKAGTMIIRTSSDFTGGESHFSPILTA
jgi:hypothetical protein